MSLNDRHLLSKEYTTHVPFLIITIGAVLLESAIPWTGLTLAYLLTYFFYTENIKTLLMALTFATLLFDSINLKPIGSWAFGASIALLSIYLLTKMTKIKVPTNRWLTSTVVAVGVTVYYLILYKLTLNIVLDFLTAIGIVVASLLSSMLIHSYYNKQTVVA